MAGADREHSFTYGETGVDVDIEAMAARILYEASKETWKNRAGKLGEVIVPFDDFSGLRFTRIDNLPTGTISYSNNDGVATKVEFAEQAQRFDTLGFDLVAMLVDDAAIQGVEPAQVKEHLIVNTLGQDESRLGYIRELAAGLVAAANEAGVAVIKGEIAQHNDRMGPLDKFSVEWGGDVTWYGHESRLITGYAVQPGDYLVGLREEGLRCNGISLVRTLLRREYGDKWEGAMFEEERLIDVALRPSRIYAKAIVDMVGGYDLNRKPKAEIHGAAHITGSGIPGKLSRTLKPSGLGAIIDKPFDPNALMLHCQQLGNVTDHEAHKTWHMGQGLILISPEPAPVIEVAGIYGHEAKVIGRVTKKPGIVIYSKGFERALLRY